MEIKRYFLLLLLGLLAGVGCRHSQAMGLQQHALSQPVRTGLERPSMNRAFLSDAPYRKLLIEIDYDERDPPSRHAVNVLRKWLERHVAKPDGIRIVIGDEIPRSRFRPDRASLVEIAREHASGPPDDDTYYVYVLYAPRYGKYRGIAWRAGGLSGDMPFPVVGMMNKQLRIDSFLWLTRRKVEAAVLVHEFGHVAGLVSASDHNDGSRHCTNPPCRMYRRVDMKSVAATAFPVLCKGILPTAFCAQCERDIAYGRDPSSWPSDR